MDLRPFYFGALENDARIISNIDRSRYQSETPCDDWNVHALLNHFVGGVFGFAKAVQRESLDRTQDFVGDDPSSAFQLAQKEAVDAWSAPDALEGNVTISIGEVPATMALRIALLEAIVHGWDLAKATGQDHGIDPMVATAMLDGMRKTITADQRGPGKIFDEEVQVASDAPIQEQLVAFLGRQP